MPSTLLWMKAVPRMAVYCKHNVTIGMSIFLGRISNCEIWCQGLPQPLISIASPIWYANLSNCLIAFFFVVLSRWYFGLLVCQCAALCYFGDAFNIRPSMMNNLVSLDEKIPQDSASFILQHWFMNMFISLGIIF